MRGRVGVGRSIIGFILVSIGCLVSMTLFIGLRDNTGKSIHRGYLNMRSSMTTIKKIPIGEADVASGILNEPSWLKNRSWGLSNRSFTEWSSKEFHGSSLDSEEELGWTNFFHGMTNGLMLELGGMDGKAFTSSLLFEEKADWKVILIEASKLALQIPKTRPQALSLRLAVCESKSMVHFVEGESVGGILEFMTPMFLEIFHPDLLKKDYEKGLDVGIGVGSLTGIYDIVDWDNVNSGRLDKVTQLPCLPLQLIFDHFGISRINFMVMDLEGGEISALKSLDFQRIEFDVICVETKRFVKEEERYIDEVVEFMVSKGYKVAKRSSGRNSWFVSPNWNKF